MSTDFVAPIYLDYAATTPVRPEVAACIAPFFGAEFGNPSSAHRWGRAARAALEDARERLAACIGADADEVYFTSGGTEGDNLAVVGAFRSAQSRRAVVTTPIEHKAVLAAVHGLAAGGAVERLLAVDGDGVVTEDAVLAAVGRDTAVVSVGWVNNEIGTVQDLPALAAVAKAAGGADLLVHSDAVQAFGKVAIDARRQAFDLLTLSGHKIGAPKGIGALYVRRGAPLAPLLAGGGQERGLRPGTENVAFAVGFARAAELAVAEREATGARLRTVRDALQSALLAAIPDAIVHAANAPRAPHVLNLSVPGIDGGALLRALDDAGIAVSAGSACSSGSTTPSHVLLAIGVEPALARGALRFSLGADSTARVVPRVAAAVGALVDRLRAPALVA